MKLKADVHQNQLDTTDEISKLKADVHQNQLEASSHATIAIRSERLLAAQEVMVLKKKHQSAMQRKDKAVSAMSRISEGKLDAEKSKSLSQSLDLLATISVQQQDNFQLKESLDELIVEAWS